MNIFKNPRLLTLLAPIVTLAIFEIFIFFPKSFYYLLILLILIIVYIIRQFAAFSENKKIWLGYFIFPNLFIISSALYLILITSNLVIQLIVFAAAGFVYLYLKHLYFIIIKKEDYFPDVFKNISAFGNFLLAFYFFSFIFGLQSFLNTPTWLLALISLPIIFLIINEDFKINAIAFKPNLFYILINTLILSELLWSLSFLPQNYNVIGLVLAISYYLLINLTKLRIEKNLNTSNLKKYLIFGFVCILLIILTSRWM
ncbi:MAG: hypothetical protein PHT51_02120 [Patescibacteria group bacterium]|nr:hypothetical protein [Patescibacteria group bacterium]MDD4611025.1 hypothetical protein [Patescibacteria group bacterium]